MQLEQALDGARFEDAAVAARRRQQHVAGESLEVAAEPVGKRHGKAVLLPVDDRVRQDAAHRLLEDVLRVAAVQAELRRNGRRELHELVVEQRRPRLN